MKKKIFLIYILILKQTLTIYGEKLLLQKFSKKSQKISKKKNLKEIEKLFFYEERTDSYKEELTKLMKRYNFKINLKKIKIFGFHLNILHIVNLVIKILNVLFIKMIII